LLPPVEGREAPVIDLSFAARFEVVAIETFSWNWAGHNDHRNMVNTRRQDNNEDWIAQPYSA
jgi:hypothetical protein